MTPIHQQKTVSIVSIGTELTSGELANQNAAWLSDKLSDFGFEVVHHITVPDDRPLIQMAFEESTKRCGVILVTGGLGPTSDDFTREEIASFCKRPLVWNEDSWQAVVRRLNSVGAPLVESNRQQCFFPEGSEILSNSQGTAAGFIVSVYGTTLIALPGPPSEIAAIWNDHLVARLQSRIPPEDRTKLYRFICMGMSESKLAELVENTLKGAPVSIGYRARIPYVDVKVWAPNKSTAVFEATWLPKLVPVISDVLVGQNQFDAAESCVAVLPKARSIKIFDTATGGHLARRLFQTGSDNLTRLDVTTTLSLEPDYPHDEVITVLSNTSDGTWSLARRLGGTTQRFDETSRYKGVSHRDRFQRLICEKTLVMLQSWWAAEAPQAKN